MTKRGLRRLAALGIATVILAAALGGALLVKQRMHLRELASLREQGLALHQAGEYNSAIPPLRRYIRSVKDDPEVLIAFGLCRQEVELPNDQHIVHAISALKTALDLAPGDARATEALMDLFARAGYLTELVDICGTMLELEPGHKKAMIYRVDALILLGHNAEAVSGAEELVALHGDVLEAHDLRLKALRQAGRPSPELFAALQAHEARFSEHPGFFDRLSRLQWETGNRDEAVRLARKAASLPPHSAGQVAVLVDWLRALNQTMPSRSQASSRDPGDAGAEAEQSLVEVADALFSRAIEDDTIGPFLAIEATRRAWWADQAELAGQYAVRLNDPLLADNRDAAGWAALVALSLDGSVPESADAPVAPTPDSETDTPEIGDWEAIVGAGRSLAASKPEQALQWLAGFAPSSEQTRALGRYLYGLSLQRIGDLLSATTAYREVLEMRGIDRDRARKSFGEVLAGLGMYKESEAAYRGITRRDAIPAQTRIDLYLSQLEVSRDPVIAQIVLRAIREAMAVDPDHPAVRVRLCRALILAGREKQGLEEARGLLEDGTAPDPAGLLGLCWTIEGIDDTLVLELLASFQAVTGNADLLYSRAMLMARSGGLPEARAMIEAQIQSRTGTDAVPYLHTLARLLDLYDKESALGVYRTLTDDYPESATAQLAVLESITPWGELDLVNAAVARLRAVAGESSLSWRVYEARMILAENPSDNELSRVVLNLREVLDADPNNFFALFLSAKAYVRFSHRHDEQGSKTEVAENIDQAAAFFDRAVGPASRAFAYRPYVEMLLDHGRVSQAEKVLDRFMAEDNIPYRCRADRIELLTSLGRWRDAIEDQAWFATTGEATTVLNLAELHARSGDGGRARSVVEDFLSSPDREPGQRLQAARVYAIMEDYPDAQAVLESLPEQSELGRRDAVIGDFFMEYRSPTLALPFLTKVARESGRIEDWVTVIQAAVGTGSQDTMKSLLAEARLASPDAPELAVFDTDSQSRRSAQVFAASVGPDSPEDLRQLAAIASSHAFGRLNEQEFIDQLAAFSESRPGVFAAWRLRTITLNSLGEPEMAIEVARVATAALPHDPRPVRELANLLSAAGRIDEAIVVANSLADLTRPDTYEADVIIAQLELSRGRPKDAVNRLVVHRAQMRAQSDERPTAGFTVYVLALARAGQPDEAAELLTRRWNSAEPVWIELILRGVNALPDALWAAKREWLRNIEDDRYALVRAEMWVRIGRYSGSRSDIVRATELIESQGDPADPTWRYVLAETAALSDRFGQAESDYHALIEAFPDLIESYAGIGDVLSRQPDRAADAVEFIDDALARFGSDQDTAGYLSLRLSRARALEIAGNTADAHSAYQLLLDKIPDHAGAAIGLARLLLDAGDTDRARAIGQIISDPANLDARTQHEYTALQVRLQEP